MAYMKSQKQEYFLPKTLNPASALDRIAAHLIDIILLILCSFAISLYAGTYGLIISSSLFFVYFLICHLLWGQTLGKKIIGIRLISVGAQSLTLWRVLSRETLGRVFCVGSLFLGYVRVLFSKDRRGVHDLLSGSAVISDKHYQTSFAHFAAIVFTVLLTLSFSTYFLFFKTTFIAKAVLTVLQHQGVQVSSLSGNMAKGWHIDSFAGGNNMVSYNLKGIHIKHSPAGFYSNGTWRVQDLMVDELSFRVDPQLLNLNYIQRKSSSVSFKAATSAELQFAMYKLKGLVDALRIGKLKVTDGDKLNLVFDNIQGDKISYADGVLSIAGLKTAEASPAKIDVGFLTFKPLDQSLQLKMKMLAKKEMHQSLKKDLNLVFNWSGSLSAPERFKVVAFENRFQMNYDKGHLSVMVNNLTPSQHLQSSISFRDINAKLKHTNCESTACVQSLQGSGSFLIQNRKVDFKNTMAWLDGSETEVLRFSYNDLVLALFETQPVLKVISDESLQDFIAQFYFQKPVHLLSAVEQSLVQRDQGYFKVMKERFDPNKPKHIDTFLLRSPSELSESK